MYAEDFAVTLSKMCNNSERDLRHNGFNRISRGNLPGNEVVHVHVKDVRIMT